MCERVLQLDRPDALHCRALAYSSWMVGRATVVGSKHKGDRKDVNVLKKWKENKKTRTTCHITFIQLPLIFPYLLLKQLSTDSSQLSPLLVRQHPNSSPLVFAP
jgi:hypothetical protein